MIRKNLSAPGLYALTRSAFSAIKDHRTQSNVLYPLPEVLSSGLAMFAFKYPSLLKFIETSNGNSLCAKNIRSLFNISKVASETQLRDILDPIHPESFRAVYDDVLRELQRGGELNKFDVLGYYPVALDGTGYFSSSKIKCPHCLTKKQKGSEGELEYHHQMLGASIVHPFLKQVIPLFPEPIMNEDGATKNDCERNASKRWVEKFRIHHPKMPALILEDSLSSNIPHLKTLLENDCRYLTGVKESDHKYLFEQYRINSNAGCTKKLTEVIHTGIKTKTTTTKSYEFVSGLELNRTDCEFKTNFIFFTERIVSINAKGKEKVRETTFSWITDLDLKEKDLPLIVTTARRRWAIENENFQTLKKSTDYNMEHNYGHGKQFLAVNFALLCILSFLIDQTQEIACQIFKEIVSKSGSKRGLWEDIRGALKRVMLENWAHFLDLLSEKITTDTT